MKLILFSALSLLLYSCAPPVHERYGTEQSKFNQKRANESQFDFVHRTIIRPRCVACHNSKEAPHGINLESFETITQNSIFPPLVVPGEAEQSSLYSSIVSGKMPKGPDKLSKTQISNIAQWIEAGATKSDQTAPPPEEDDDGDEPGDEPEDDPAPLPGEPPDDDSDNDDPF